MGFAVAAASTGTFSLLNAVGTLLCAPQHTRGLSPTSQFPRLAVPEVWQMG